MPAPVPLLALPLLLAPGLAPQPPAPGGLEIGAPVPPLALPDLDGRVHDLAALRGRIVVLEWTSHACPAVARLHEARLPSDARDALDPERVAWLQVDSSWFAPLLADDVRAWRARLGLDVPYLLDADGRAARAFDVRATPQLFVVDAEGRLAYEGALDDGGWEPERRDHVVEAVRALLAGEPVPVARTRPVGCTVKLVEGAPPATVSRADVVDAAEAEAAYRRAAAAARDGRHGPALDAFAEALERELPAPWRAVADPAFRGLLADDPSRRALAERLGRHPPSGRLTMVAPAEPGEPFVVCGTVRDPAGRPIPGAEVRLYHTDAAGWYAPGSTRGENPRLFGRVLADARGRYRVRTILPAPYATSPSGAIHVHMGFRAEGHRTRSGHPASLFFDDDPNLVGAEREEIEGDGCAILRRTRNAEGVTLCVYDVELAAE